MFGWPLPATYRQNSQIDKNGNPALRRVFSFWLLHDIAGKTV